MKPIDVYNFGYAMVGWEDHAFPDDMAEAAQSMGTLFHDRAEGLQFIKDEIAGQIVELVEPMDVSKLVWELEPDTKGQWNGTIDGNLVAVITVGKQTVH